MTGVMWAWPGPPDGLTATQAGWWHDDVRCQRVLTDWRGQPFEIITDTHLLA